MSASKIVSTGNYEITTLAPSGNVVMNTNTLFVTGNLVVVGTSTNVQAFDTTLSIFHINYGASSPHAGLSGLENVRGGPYANVGIYWDEDGTYAGQWIANNALGNIGPVLTSFNTKIEKTTASPVGQTGYVVVTGNTAASGGSGLFVNAGTSSNELVTTASAKKYGIIFG